MQFLRIKDTACMLKSRHGNGEKGKKDELC